MTPFYFGEAESPLFGIHHQPQSSQYQDAAVVLCYPIGFEYGRSHSLIRFLASQLAAQGYHVLRFDYYATGDSSGASTDITLQQCQHNIVLACDEIKSISATRKVIVVGYRFGALLAAYTAQTYKFSRLILWDPVVDGESYLDDLQTMHNKMLHDPNRFDLRYNIQEANPDELIGHAFSAEFRNEIKSYKLLNIAKLKTRNLDAFCCEGGYRLESVVNGDGALSKLSIHHCDGRAEWTNIDKIESKVLPGSSIKEIIEVVG